MKPEYIPDFDIRNITDVLEIRSLREHGISLLENQIKQHGYNPEFSLSIHKNENGTYTLLAGHHRTEALKRLEKYFAPAIVYSNLTYNEKLKIAHQSNEDTINFIPMTFVDNAEMIWRELNEEKKKITGMTQEKLAQSIGWGRTQIANYDALKKINKKAWNLIVTTTNNDVTTIKDDTVTTIVTDVTFTENLLRNILQLNQIQQLELLIHHQKQLCHIHRRIHRTINHLCLGYKILILLHSFNRFH